METNNENQISVTEARSYARCIKVGLSVASDHMGVILYHTWPSLLLAMLLPALGLLLFMWQVGRLMREWGQLGYIPRRKPADGWRTDMRHTLRTLVASLLYTALLALTLAVVCGAYLLLPYGIWVAIVLLIAIMLLTMPSILTFNDMICTAKPLPQCMKSWRSGYRHYSSLFPFVLLIFMLTFIISLPGLIPLTAVITASCKAYTAMQQGDTVMMPPLWPLAVIAAYFVVMVTLALATIIYTTCTYLFCGSLQAREADEKEQEQA